MADHDSFGWSSGAAGIDEGGTAAGFLLLGTVLDGVFDFIGFESVLFEYYLSPIAMKSFHKKTLSLSSAGMLVGRAPFQMT